MERRENGMAEGHVQRSLREIPRDVYLKGKGIAFRATILDLPYIAHMQSNMQLHQGPLTHQLDHNTSQCHSILLNAHFPL